MSRKEFSAQSSTQLENLAAWLQECSQRYKSAAEKLGPNFIVDLPYEKALKIAVHNLKLHLRGAEETIEDMADPIGKIDESAAKAVAETKKSYQNSKKKPKP
jgi:hypothetical protein